MRHHRKIRTLLVANRGEISIRVMRAAHEIGIKTVSICSQEDRFSLHRMKADAKDLLVVLEPAVSCSPWARSSPC